MGKSNKKTNVQVSPGVSAVSGKSSTKGKRDAEKVLDKSVVAKKKKTETEMVVQEEDIEKLKKAQQEVPSKRKPETTSSDYDISSNSEEEEGASEGVKMQTASDTKLEKKEESSPSERDTDEGNASTGHSSSEESSEKSSDVESEDEKPLKISTKDKDVKMKSATVDSDQKQTAKKSGKPAPKTPLVQNQTSGSLTLFVGNLSYDVGQEDLLEFFKSAGEVVAVRMATRLDGSFKGFGHIDFATEDDVKKALELNDQKFFGRALRLEVARERDSHTPQSGHGKDSKGQSYTIFVKGFDKSLGQDQIRNSLQEHFGSCGGITRISMPKDYESGALKGIAYMDFKDQDAYNKAIELNGSELGECTLTVEEAKPKGDNSNGGRNSSRDGGAKFGRSGGRGGRRDRGRGRSFSGRGRGRGRGRGGKKTNFGDD